jgi:CRISPR-associated endonuclease Csn1
MIPLAENIILDSEKDSFNKGGLQKKKRIDNRHHALDAVVIAYASRGYHNFLNRVHAKGYKINYDEKTWLSEILRPPGNKNLEDFKSGIINVMVNANISIKHDHNNKGQLVKSTAYKLYYSEIGKYIITTLKSVSEIPFKQKEKPQDTLWRALCKFEDRLSDIKDKKLRKKLEDNIAIYKSIQNESALSKAKQELEEFDLKAKKEGKKGYEKITDILIYKKACSIHGGKYIHVENKIENKFFALKEPTEIETGFGYDTADNLSLDLYHDNNGKLCGEVIRKIDFNRNRVPNYKKEGYILLERIYQGDTLEVDISDDKISLKNKVGSAPYKRTFVKVLTFTESDRYLKNKRDQIQIFFCNLLKSTLKHDDSFYVSSMQKYNARKVILTSLGIIKYRSKILKNKEI